MTLVYHTVIHIHIIKYTQIQRLKTYFQTPFCIKKIQQRCQPKSYPQLCLQQLSAPPLFTRINSNCHPSILNSLFCIYFIPSKSLLATIYVDINVSHEVQRNVTWKDTNENKSYQESPCSRTNHEDPPLEVGVCKYIILFSTIKITHYS